jgi:hypothetical protein
MIASSLNFFLSTQACGFHFNSLCVYAGCLNAGCVYTGADPLQVAYTSVTFKKKIDSQA